jgi:hypothetical protein
LAFQKISAFIFKVREHGFRSQNKKITLQQNCCENLKSDRDKIQSTHIHTLNHTKYLPATHDVARRGEPFAGRDRSSGAHSSSLFRTYSVTKVIFHLDTVLDLLLLFSFGSLLPINTSLTKHNSATYNNKWY